MKLPWIAAFSVLVALLLCLNLPAQISIEELPPTNIVTGVDLLIVQTRPGTVDKKTKNTSIGALITSMGLNFVDSAKIVDGTIQSDDLAPLSVDDTKLNLTSPNIGDANAQALSANSIVSKLSSNMPKNLGNITNTASATLDQNYSDYTLISSGAAWTLAVPGGMPDGWYSLVGTNTYASDRQTVTLSNAAIRPEQNASVATNQFHLAQSSSAKYEITLLLTGGLINMFSVTGDDFSPATPASVVTVVPSGSITALNVQAALEQLDSAKANTSSLSTVATTGQYNDLIGEPVLVSQAEAEAGLGTTVRAWTAQRVAQAAAATFEPIYFTAYASGTPASVSTTPGLLDFGTIDPNFTLTNSGKWLLNAQANVRYVGATYAALQTITLKLRRTNNTAADLTNAFAIYDTAVVTTQTGALARIVLPPIYYDTLNTNDAIALWGLLSANPSAGSIQVDQAAITALRIGPPTADTTPPTLISASIGTFGTNLTIVLDEIVTFGAGGTGGFTLTASGGAASLTYAAGDGTTTINYLVGRTIQQPETLTLAYTQPGNGLEDAAGNDKTTFSGTAVTNGSTQNTATLQQSTGGATGDLTVWNTSSRVFIGQLFTPASNYQLTKIVCYLKAGSATSGTIAAHLYATSGTHPSTLIQTSSTTLDSATLTSSYVGYEFVFTTSLTSGTTYAVDLSKSVTSGNPQWQTGATSSYERSGDAVSWTTTSGTSLHIDFWGY